MSQKSSCLQHVCVCVLQGALQVLEGQLFLLLSLTMAGGQAAQKASTKAVADAGVLPALARCK
jgi:hypothetical protein